VKANGRFTYDHRFLLKALASHNEQWSTIDITLWNITFPKRLFRVVHLQTLLKGHDTNINTNQSTCTGTKTLMDAVSPLAISSTHATEVSTTPELKTRTTKSVSVL